MKVDLPAPFGPKHATLEDNESWIEAPAMICLSVLGYLNQQLVALTMALSLFFTPSKKPGAGKMNFNSSLENSVYFFAAGH